MKIVRLMCMLCIFSLTLLAPHDGEAREGVKNSAEKGNRKHIKKHIRSGHRHRKHEEYLSVPKKFVPLDSLSPRQIEAINAYNQCVNNEDDDPVRYAMKLAYEYKDEPSLKGTPVKLGRESCLADMFHLSRYETIDDIGKAIKRKELVLVDPPFVEIPDDIPIERRFARVWVKDYITSLAHDMEIYMRSRGIVALQTHVLRVPSIVRSFDVQDRLVRSGRSPANCNFRAICSTHTTGSTIDISTRRIGIIGYTWLLERLLQDRKDGKILVILESLGGHFHVFVIPPAYISWYGSGSPLKEPPP